MKANFYNRSACRVGSLHMPLRPAGAAGPNLLFASLSAGKLKPLFRNTVCLKKKNRKRIFF